MNENCITCARANWRGKAVKGKNIFGSCRYVEEFYRHGLGKVVRSMSDDHKIENCNRYEVKK